MSAVWYTSDLHFGHQKVAAMRGYDNPQKMNEVIAEQWIAHVSPDDVVWVLGDIAVSHYTEALALFFTLPGRKRLIVGNHDLVHPMHQRSRRPAEQLRWHSVFDIVEPYAKLRLNGHEVLLSHFPYSSWGDGTQRGGSRYNQYRLPDLGAPLVHGHTHGAERAHGHSFHVGWDAWHELVPQERIVDWLDGNVATSGDE